jgi:hypothetical protein
MRTLAATLVAVAGMFLIVVGAVVAVMGALGTLSQAGGLDLGYQPILFLVGGRGRRAGLVLQRPKADEVAAIPFFVGANTQGPGHERAPRRPHGSPVARGSRVG